MADGELDDMAEGEAEGQADVDAGAADEAADIAAPAVAPGLMEHEAIFERIRSDNIAKDLDEDTLGRMGQRVFEEFTIDDNSRDAWLKQSKESMDLAMQVAKQKDYPWSKSSNVIYPLMTVAAMQFASRATPAIIAGRDVVKGVVYGPDGGVPALHPTDGTQLVDTANGQPVWVQPPGAKQARATRIGDHMSYQLLEEYREWRGDTDQMLHILPIVGCHFRKSFFDPAERCNVSTGVSAENVVINYHAKSMERVPRITEKVLFYPIEIAEHENAELFLKPESPYGRAQSAANDEDAPHEFLEQHRRWDIDGDGYAEPYVVTVHKDSRKVVRVVARYDAEGVMLRAGKVDRINPVHYYTKFDFLPSIDGGIYGIGFGQLLKPLNEAVNTTLNMLIDAGHLAIVGGGFIGKGLSMHAGSVKFQMGEWKTVNAPGGNIRDAIVPLPVREPSAVLFSLLGMLIDAGKEISAVKDVLSGEINGVTMQPTTLLALIEQGLKVFTGIYGRVYDALGEEFHKLHRLNRIYLEDTARYKRGDEWKTITRDDYMQNTGVAPVSNPDMVSDAKNMAQAQLLKGYENDPLMDGLEIRKRVLTAAKVPNMDALFAKQRGPSAADVALARELENETIKTRAAAIKDLALAQKAIAEADKARGEAVLNVIGTQFEILQAQLDRIDGEDEQAAAAAAPATAAQAQE